MDELREEILDRLISLIETYKMDTYMPNLLELAHHFEVRAAVDFIEDIYECKEVFASPLRQSIKRYYREIKQLVNGFIAETEV
jgi:hypothetical protein